MSKISLSVRAAIGVLLCASGASHAYEFRARWVERVGSVDVAIESDILINLERTPRRVRLQIGVFDDAQGPAPVGGVLGWEDGTMMVDTAQPTLSHDTRTPGRLAPFTSSSDPNANGNPPLPAGDPFEMLTDINATLGHQTHVWGFNEDGTPAIQPPPTVRGRNRFVSVFEITVDPAPNFPHSGYHVNVAGQLRAVNEWRVFGEPFPPDPDSGEPGSVTYFPLTTDAIEFESSLFVYVVPSPGAAAVLVLGVLANFRRRR